MISRRTLISQAAAGLGLAPALSLVGPAAAADYPVGPVKIIVAQGAGGSLDVLLRLIADHLSRIWGSQVVVVNAPTGGGVVAARTVAGATPDGHTLFLAGASVFTVLPETQPSLAAEIADFVPICFTGEQPMAIAVTPSVAAKSLSDLIELSRQTPNGLNCAVSARNSLAHLTGELFRLRSGANLNFIYYPGAAQALNDVISGRVQVIVNILPGIAGAIAGNQIRVLAITSQSRLPSFPSIPIAAEAVPDFNVSGWTVLVAPANTAPTVVQKIYDDVRTIQEQPEFKQRLEALGVYTRPMSRQQVSDYITAEQKLWRPLVRELGVKAR
jgi:tripartite-type tricarboxylate transporter receptor subunit TctC